MKWERQKTIQKQSSLSVIGLLEYFQDFSFLEKPVKAENLYTHMCSFPVYHVSFHMWI